MIINWIYLKKFENVLRNDTKNVAAKIGRTQQIVGHWETGYSQPDADTLFTLSSISKEDYQEDFNKNPEKGHTFFQWQQ